MFTTLENNDSFICLLLLFMSVNISGRDYQFAMTQTALFSNTLVVLPTGLGKTFIAAVVMYNYFRWFPEGNAILRHIALGIFMFIFFIVYLLHSYPWHMCNSIIN